MKKWFVIFCCLFWIKGSVIYCFAEQNMEPVTIKESELFSQGAVLMDASTGRILYGKNADMQLAMASTTKIMTCITALEEGDVEEYVTASAYAASQPKVKLHLAKGEQVKCKDLLYSLMLESHNDSAVAIAEHIGAKILGLPVDKESVKSRTKEQSMEAMKAFISKMNEKARELQCYNTWFITPNGLDGTETFTMENGEIIEKYHSTTAAELARIMSYCILQSPKKADFLEITGTYSYSFSNEEKTRSFVCRNHNAFLNMMEGVISGKTGYTGRAGYCYVGALERDGRYFIVALLNSGAYGGNNKSRKWEDAKKLMNYGLENYRQKQLYDGSFVSDSVLVQGARPEAGKYYEPVYVKTEVVGNEPVSVLKADWENYEIRVTQEEYIQAPISKGQSTGSIEVIFEEEVLVHYEIICVQNIEQKTFLDSLFYTIFCFLL